MRPIEKYVAELMEKKGVKSYLQLSLALQMGPNTIFQIMSKGVTPSDELCRKLAELAGDPVEKVLILAAESRAPESTRAAWDKILKTMAKAGAFSLILMVFFSPALPSFDMSQTMDIMSNITGMLIAVENFLPFAFLSTVLALTFRKPEDEPILI